MIEKYKKIIERNNKEIIESKETIKKYYSREVDIYPYKIDNINDENELNKIINQQKKDIDNLNIIIDIELQNKENKRKKEIELLKEKETDKEFSKLYRKGIIEINNIDVSIDKFYIKELLDNNKIIYNFICTDNRIDKKVFGTIDDKKYELKHIYKLKDSKVFHNIYLDKELFIDNKIVLNNKEQLKKFMNYVFKWTPEVHTMVAETMIKEVVE